MAFATNFSRGVDGPLHPANVRSAFRKSCVLQKWPMTGETLYRTLYGRRNAGFQSTLLSQSVRPGNDLDTGIPSSLALSQSRGSNTTLTLPPWQGASESLRCLLCGFCNGVVAMSAQKHLYESLPGLVRVKSALPSRVA